MLSIKLDEENGIAVLEPGGRLSREDFEAAAKQVDSYIEKSGPLNGLVIHSERFPGWDSFAALSSHLRFVKEHHKKISRVAFASDSPLGHLAETVGRHFVNAEIKAFPFSDLEKAEAWAAGKA